MAKFDNRNIHDRTKWTPTQLKIDWIESCLCNDEASSDEELVQLFIDEGEMDKEVAIMIVRQRNGALYDPFKFKLDIEDLNLA
jgi:hypothetical protein